MKRKISSEMTAAEAYAANKMQHVFIKLNERCNARCSFCHCWTIKEDTGVVDVFRLTEDLIRIGPNEVNLSGGEVILFPRFWELLEAGRGAVPWSITTNGSVIAVPDMLPRLKDSGVRRLYISLDSHVPERHDASRGTPGMFRRVLRAMDTIKRSGWRIELIVNHVVTRLNAADIGDFLEFCAAAGADGINLIPIKDAQDLYLSKSDVVRFYEAIGGRLVAGVLSPGFFLNHNWEIFGRTDSDFECAERGDYRFAYKRGCAIPALSAFIDCATGNVFPCDTTYWRRDATSYVMGNLTTETIDQIWAGEKYRSFRDAMYPNVGHPCFKQCDPNNYLFEPLVQVRRG